MNSLESPNVMPATGPTPKERLEAKLPYRSVASGLVTGTDQLRKRRQTNRVEASQILSSLQDTIIPPSPSA